MTCPVCNGDALVPDPSVAVLGNRPCDACHGSGDVDAWRMVSASAICPQWSGIVIVTTVGDHVERTHTAT